LRRDPLQAGVHEPEYGVRKGPAATRSS
jgi:hypothetical protein